MQNGFIETVPNIHDRRSGTSSKDDDRAREVQGAETDRDK